MRVDFLDRKTLQIVPESIAEDIALTAWVEAFKINEANLHVAVGSLGQTPYEEQAIEGDFRVA